MDWVDEFLNLMSGATIDVQQIMRAHAIKNDNLPFKLYKYRPVNEYSLNNFKTDTVWVCSTDKYNDPYECAFTLNFDLISRENIKKKFDELISGPIAEILSNDELTGLQNSEAPMKDIVMAVLRHEKKIPPEKYNRIVSDLLGAAEKVNSNILSKIVSYAQQSTKVCSFSSRSDSVVMWGHYANGHAGFCLEYDLTRLSQDDVRRRALWPVTYSSEMFDATKYITQSMNHDSFNNLFGMLAATRKSKDWSYEQEWRVVLPMGKSIKDMNYSMPVPSALYIGSRTSEKDTADLTAIAESKGIPIFKMRLSTTKVLMEPEPM